MQGGAADPGCRRAPKLVPIRQATAEGKARRGLPEDLGSRFSTQVLSHAPQAARRVRAEPGERRSRATSETAEGRHPQRVEVEAVPPSGRVLVELGSKVDGDLLAQLLQPFDAGPLREAPQSVLTHLLRRLFGDFFEPFADGLLGDLADEAAEDLLDDHPGRADRRGRARRRRARGERHRDPEGEQLPHQDADFNPNFDFRGFDVAADILHDLTDFVAHGGQEVQGGVVIARNTTPRLLERVGDRSRVAVSAQHVSRGVLRVLAWAG